MDEKKLKLHPNLVGNPYFDREASYRNWRKWFYGEPHPEPDGLTIEQRNQYGAALMSNQKAPWEDDYFVHDEDSNIVTRLIEVHPGYLDLEPEMQYYLRQAFIAGTMEEYRMSDSEA